MYSIGQEFEFQTYDQAIKAILSKIEEYDIMDLYLSSVTSGERLVIGRKYKSPFRSDSNPSFGVFSSDYTKYKYRWKDLGTGESGSCFDLVMRLFPGLTLGGALNRINLDFGLGITGCADDSGSQYQSNYVGTSNSQFPKIPKEFRIRSRKFSSVDKSYWYDQYKITSKTLKLFNIHAVDIVWCNGKQILFYKQSDPIYAYRFGNGIYKIYMPLREKGNRWLSNTTSNHMQGYNQLPACGELLIVTKSLKDVCCLYEHGIPAIAPQSETSINLPDHIVTDIKNRFKTIVVLYDNDETGKINSVKIKEKYQFSDVWEIDVGKADVKDFSDYIKYKNA